VASRAEALEQAAPGGAVPAAPSFGSATRAALADLYYHSWRLVPANVVWSATAVLVFVALVLTPVGVVAIPILALPTAGLFRMATRIARGRSVSFWDAVAAWRVDLPATLAIGAGLALAGGILAINLVTGIVTGSLVGWAFATLAFWGLVGTWLIAWAAWPVVEDPARSCWPVRDRLHLAALLVLAHPIRIGGLALGLAVFLAASLVAIVALVTVSVAVAAVVAARYVLPAADRLEAQLGFAAARGLRPAIEADPLD
jgi:hypothetical protein